MFRTETEYGVVHCTATPASYDLGIEEVHRWHLARGINSSEGSFTGYHAFIRRSGEIQYGRWESEVGAHCRGINDRSISVCLAGGINNWRDQTPENNFNLIQLEALADVLDGWEFNWPDIKIIGHNDYNTSKACPSFDIREWWAAYKREREHGR